MLNQETLLAPAASPATRRLFKPGTALRIVLALVTVLYVAGPTAIQWMAMSDQRAEVAALRQSEPPATLVARSADQVAASDPLANLLEGGAPDELSSLVRPALARVANIDLPASRLVGVIQAAALRVVQVAVAALLALVITARRSSVHDPKHARPGMRVRLLVRRNS